MDERFTEIETRIAWLEHSLRELDKVVGALHDQLDALRTDMGQVRGALSREIETSRNLEDEKPPHW